LDIFYWSSIAAFFLTLFLAVFVYFEDKQRSTHKVLGLFVLILAVGIFGDFYYRIPIINSSFIPNILRGIFAIVPFSPALWVHFIFLFTKIKPKKHVLSTIYLSSLVLSVLNVLFPKFIFSEVSLTATHLLKTTPSIGFYLFAIYIFGGATLSLYFVIKARKRSAGHFREQLNYYLFANVIIFIAVILYAIAVGFFPGFPRLDNVFLSIYVLIIVYSITRRELLNIKLLVGRLLTYGLLVAGVGFVMYMSRFSVDSFYLSSLVAFVISTWLASFIFIKGKRSLINRVFAGFLLTLSAGIFGDYFYYTPVVNNIAPRELLRAAYVITPFSASTLLHFIFLFTKTKPPKGIVPLLYTGSILLMVLNLAIPAFYFQSATVKTLGELSTTTTLAYHVFSSYNLMAVLLSFVFVIRRRRKSRGKLRAQMNYYLFAAVSIICAALLYSIAMGISPNTPRLDNIFLVLYVCTIAYSITKSELFQIQIVISRTLAYGLTYASVIFIFLLMNLHIKEPNIKVWFNLFYCLLCALVAPRVRGKLQTGLEEKFVSDDYEPNKVIDEITKDITGVYEREGIFKILIKAIEAIIKTKDSHLLVLEKGTERTNNIFHLYDKDMIEVASMDPDNPVIKYFHNKYKPIKFSKLDKEAQGELKKYYINRFSILIPLYSPPNLFDGLLIVGQKVSEAAYTNKDIGLFQTIINFTKVILDRLRPYEEIKQEYAEDRERVYEAKMMEIQAKKNEDFAYTIQEYNHEIRTPLTMLIGAIHTLLYKIKGQKPISNLKEELDDMLKNGERMNDIVGTTLRLTPGSISERKRKRDPQGINEIIQQALDLYTFVHEVKVIKNFNEEEIYVFGVNNDIERIFINLIRNADEAMPKGGKLQIKTSLQNQEACIEIKDTGIGIPEEDQQKVWEIHRSRHVTKGRGLGLSIVHRLVTEHQARITLNSIEGEGTTFTVLFPTVEAI
jgi:signal transduction histidine kinase